MTGRNDDKRTFTCEKFLNILNKYKNFNWASGFIKLLMPDLSAEQLKEFEKKWDRKTEKTQRKKRKREALRNRKKQRKLGKKFLHCTRKILRRQKNI